MREDNLLCLRKRKFVATTDSAHGMKVYPNLAAALVVGGVNQLWRADDHVPPAAGRVRVLGGGAGRVRDGRLAGLWMPRWKPGWP